METRKKLNQRQIVENALCDGCYHNSNQLRFELEEIIINVPQRISEINKSYTDDPEQYPIKGKMLPGDPRNSKSARVKWYKDTRIELRI